MKFSGNTITEVRIVIEMKCGRDLKEIFPYFLLRMSLWFRTASTAKIGAQVGGLISSFFVIVFYIEVGCSVFFLWRIIEFPSLNYPWLIVIIAGSAVAVNLYSAARILIRINSVGDHQKIAVLLLYFISAFCRETLHCLSWIVDVVSQRKNKTRLIFFVLTDEIKNN